MAANIYSETKLPTEFGDLRLRVYRDSKDPNHPEEPLALIAGVLDTDQPVNVRIHSACLTSEVLGSCKCDCKQQLDNALRYISEHSGVVIYLHQEGRGIGLGDKVRVYALQEHGYDTIEANEMLGFPIDARTYEHAGDILRDLGIRKVNLLTNNPEKIQALDDLNIEVVNRVAVVTEIPAQAQAYVETKKQRMGHMF